MIIPIGGRKDSCPTRNVNLYKQKIFHRSLWSNEILAAALDHSWIADVNGFGGLKVKMQLFKHCRSSTSTRTKKIEEENL
jgi:hypothetical protein